MRKFMIVTAIAVLMSSCYEDYVKDYDYSGIYFARQIDTRTFVVGEGMHIEAGAALGGVMKNKTTRNVSFVLDNTIVTPAVLTTMQNSDDYIKSALVGVTALSPLPSSYYTLSDNSKFVIASGRHVGTVTIRPDSVKFLSDPLTLQAGYVIPFRIVKADADTILQPKSTLVLGLKYENMLFGNYWHGGITIVKDASGKVLPDRTIKYFTTIPQPEAQVWKLSTVAPFELVTNGISNVAGSFKIKQNADGTLTVSQAPGSTVVVEQDGSCSFNKAKLLQDRKIYLKYSYANSDGTRSYAQDTLTFRNRIRDGVNEWQDENPAHYK